MRSQVVVTGVVLGMMAMPTPPSIGLTNPASSTPHQRAVAYDNSLLDRAPTFASETLLGTTPAGMAKPNQFIGSSAVVIRTRYWHSSQSVKAVYRALKTSDVTGLRLSGYGTAPVGAAPPRSAFVDFHPSRPRTIAAADLYVEIRRGGAGSVVGAFAEAVAYPNKPASEVVPRSLRKATLRRSTKPPGEKTHTSAAYRLSVTQARSLAAAFDRMPAAPPIGYHCPAPIGTVVRYRVVFRAQGHEWLVKTPFTCGAIAVRRDGRPLPALQATTQFDRRLRRTWRALNN